MQFGRVLEIRLEMHLAQLGSFLFAYPLLDISDDNISLPRLLDSFPIFQSL